jgi:type VI secretion system protein ImpA
MPNDLPPTLEPAHQEKWQELLGLCEKTLSTTSKDLQVCGWYAEARLNTEGFSGFAEGLELMAALCQRYWDTLQPFDGEGQFHSRIAVFQWLGDFVPQIIDRFPIGASSSTQEALSLFLLKTRQAQDPSGAGQQAQEDIINSFSQVEAGELDNAYGSLSQCLGAITILESFIPKMVTEGFWGEPPSLKNLREACQSLQDLFNQAYTRQGRTPSAASPTSTSSANYADNSFSPTTASFLNNSSGGLYLSAQEREHIQAQAHNRQFRINPRHIQKVDLEKVQSQGFETCDEAYGAIHRAYQYLVTNEPHSPTVFLLRRALDWQSKSLFEVYGEILRNKASPRQAFFALLGLDKT